MKPIHLRREDRLARQKAARSGWTARPERTVKVQDLEVGDFVIQIPTQSNVRGAEVNATIEAIDHEWDAWKQGRYMVPSRRLRFRNVSFAEVSVPLEFKVVVR